MKDFSSEIEAALVSAGQIPKEQVVQWIDSTSDLLTLAKLYRLTDEAYDRIKPELGPEATCGLIQHYLLECIRLNITGSDDVQGRWEATQSLHAWFCHLMEMDEDNSFILKQAANAITDLFLAGDDDIRNAIEQGFLEHALEMPALRPYFEHWSNHDQLSNAWKRALQWGEAHPNFVWGLLQQVKKLQED